MVRLVRYAVGVGLLCAATAQASTTVINFNQDPTTLGITLSGSANWKTVDGIAYDAVTNANDGFLEITPAVNSLTGEAIFPDFDHGSIVAGFNFDCWVRVGNGAGNTTPADGFSVNYARAGTPAFGNAGLGAEEGTTTGIAVGFDAYENDAVTDPRALDIWVDGTNILQYLMPTLNGSVTDPTSIQTGPNDGSGSYTILGWAHLIVTLQTNGHLTVNYKDTVILNDFDTHYRPGPGQLVMAGRTGGLNENQDVDEITITTTIAQQVTPGLAATGLADGVAVPFYDSGAGVLDTTKPATVSIDGGPAVPATGMIKNGTATTVYWYAYPTLLVSNSVHTVVASVTDTLGRVVTTPTFSFTVRGYSIVSSALAVTGVETATEGFLIKPWQSGTEPNNIWWADEQLEGLHGAINPLCDLTQATNGVFNYTGVINFDYTNYLGVMNTNGNFFVDNGYSDIQLPGIVTDPNDPATGGTNVDNSALEVLCYLHFPNPGVYEMGVNSDDGFDVTIGANPQDWGSQSLGSFGLPGNGYNGGRGSSDTLFSFIIPAAGYYPVRLVWENGTGGANLEWFVVQPSGTKILVNDPSPTNTTGVTAYYGGPALPAYVSQLLPNPGTSTGVANQFSARLTDRGTTVTSGTLALSLDGTPISSPVISQSGGVTTISGPSGFLLPVGNHKAELVYSTSGGGPFTNDWSFTVTTYIVPGWAITAVDTTQPGFRIMPYQTGWWTSTLGQGNPNAVQWTLEQLAGLHGPSDADLSTATDGGYIDYNGVINFNLWPLSEGHTDSGNFNTGNGYADSPFPGLDIASIKDVGSESMDVLCFLKFAAAGAYTMGVNSDDGFAVYAGANPSDWSTGGLLGSYNGGRGASDTTFSFEVVTPGIYPFRLIWENGGGGGAGNGASCEWFTVQPNGTKILINDPSPTNTTGVTAYFKSTQGQILPAYIKAILPEPGATGVVPIPTGGGLSTSAFGVELVDGSTTVTPASIQVTINGTPMTPVISQSSTTPKVTTVTLPLTSPLPVGTNVAQFVYSTSGGGPFSYTWSFVVGTFTTPPVLNAAWMVPSANTPGFKVMPWQSGAQNNTIWFTEEQLAGLQGANAADLTLATDNGYIDYAGIINFSIRPASVGGGDNGNFQQPTYPDGTFPGLLLTTDGGTVADVGNDAIQVVTYLQFASPGLYEMGVNSDDGFAVFAGLNPKDRNSMVVGQYNGGRGASDTDFYFIVPAAGTYPIRMIWENGGGSSAGNGANCEWFMVQPDGSRILLNDPNAPENCGVKAFAQGPALPAYVDSLTPYPGQTGAAASIGIQLANDGTTVAQGNIHLTINGTVVTPVITSQGNGITTIVLALPPAGLLGPGSSNTAVLTWTDSANNTYSDTWSFTVENYTVLDAGQSYPISDVDTTQPGFVLAVVQVDATTLGDTGDSTANQVDTMNDLLGGLYFPSYGANVADLSTAVTGNTWYWTNVLDFNIVTSPGDFTYDYALPGIPGTTGNPNYFAAGFQTYAVFPTAGFYHMGVSSDDGFRVTEGLGLTRHVLHVTGTGIDKDVASVVTYPATGGVGEFPPATPIVAPVVYMPPTGFNTMPSADLTNKIGAIEYNLPSSANANTAAWCVQTNGGLAAIVINQPGYGLPFVETANTYPVTIPVLVVNGRSADGGSGDLDFWRTNTDLVASIGADTHLMLGQADYGKGMGDVNFDFVVPTPGAYPLRMAYFQGGGGAGCEWFTVTPNVLSVSASTGRVLLNDSTNPNSFKTYRALLPAARPVFTSSQAMANGSHTITWQGAGILQSSPELGAAANWTDVWPQPGTSSYTIPMEDGQAFFRLRLPDVPTP